MHTTRRFDSNQKSRIYCNLFVIETAFDGGVEGAMFPRPCAGRDLNDTRAYCMALDVIDIVRRGGASRTPRENAPHQ
jgi:hypothetical protein